MGYFSQEFAKPAPPEWKSSWRLEQERRRAEEEAAKKAKP